ncbi:thioesterase-like superfamily-domain-containing protein [Chlamydoabsidia padenii]|nr:thioesterase-like superfamily-domain-containing protein [Chlamydoabsidia padenii]
MNTIESSEQQIYAFDKGTSTVYLGQTEQGSHIYSGEALKNFAVGEVPNGGYVVCVMFDSVLDHYSQRYQSDPVALNAFFLRKSQVGSIIVEIQDLKTNRKGYCVSKAVIKQTRQPTSAPLHSLADYHPADYIDKVVGIFTMGNMNHEQGVSWNHHESLPLRPDHRDLVPLHFEHMDDLVYVHVDPRYLPEDTQPRPMEMHQTIEFRDQRPNDFKSLAYWCDMFVPPPNTLGHSVLNGKLWCATMQMEVQFKKKCSPGLKKVSGSFVTTTLKNSRFDIDGWIRDTDGELLATTRHQCLALPWERNTPKKSKL